MLPASPTRHTPRKNTPLNSVMPLSQEKAAPEGKPFKDNMTNLYGGITPKHELLQVGNGSPFQKSDRGKPLQMNVSHELSVLLQKKRNLRYNIINNDSLHLPGISGNFYREAERTIGYQKNRDAFYQEPSKVEVAKPNQEQIHKEQLNKLLTETKTEVSKLAQNPIPVSSSVTIPNDRAREKFGPPQRLPIQKFFLEKPRPF